MATGAGRFVDASRPLGADGVRDGRGVATADLDGDGRLDIVINNNNAAPTIYLNRVKTSGPALHLELIGQVANGSPRDPVGARARLTLVDDDGTRRTLTRWLEAGSGYAAQSQMSVHFGLGTAHAEALEVTWPSGQVDRLEPAELAADRLLRLHESDRRVAERGAENGHGADG